MKHIIRLIDWADVFTGKNVRLPNHMNTEALAADICENGLEVPIEVFEVKKGKYEVIRGHRRYAAIEILSETQPERFNELFSKGISCLVIEGVSYDEAQILKIDHGNEMPLSDPMEVQLCASMLFHRGLSEKAVVTRLAGLLDRIKPMKSNRRKEYEKILADIKVLEANGELEAVKTKKTEAETFLFNYRRGMIQNYHSAYRCPNIVMAALWFKATGSRPPEDSDFFTKAELPSGLTYQHVAQLWKAFEADLKILKDGVPMYNKRLPGPGFEAKWSEICKSIAEAEAAKSSGETRTKAMSATDMQAEVSSGKWLSAGFQMLSKYHASDATVDPSRLSELDKLGFYAEILAERAPDEWKEAVKLADNLIEAQTAATKEEAAAKPKKAAKK